MTGFGRHRVFQLLVDAGIVALSWFLAFQLRFDNGPPYIYDNLFRKTILLVVAIKVVVFLLFGFHRRWWRYVSVHDMWSAARGVVVASLVAYLTVYLTAPGHYVRLPRSIAAMDLLLTLSLVAGARLLARTVMERPRSGDLVARGREVIVVGAGDAGRTVVQEMQRSRMLRYTPIGFVDDDRAKLKSRIQGVPVLGTMADLPRLVRERQPDEILIAIPSASGRLRQRVVDAAQSLNVPVKTLPGLYELISGQVDLAQIRPVQVEDVLGREQVEVPLDDVAAYLRDQTVLVTGAGGSIGAELCRQIARVGPARIVLVDQAETALFEIERELVDERGFPAGIPVLANVGERERLRHVFQRYRPSVVFHAAAYKHVPMMEVNPIAAVVNNALTTRAVAEVSIECGVERFVQISTDKAVNRQTVMGQCKLLCEWIVEAFGLRPGVRTRFVAVRFGNVLNSAGSVVPTFRRQIAKGGPVTVTHPEMTRYFMTIPEAASLVVQAGAIGGAGDVFVLDMGDPVKIVDLARNMIRLSGKQPDVDIKIDVIGTRPGETLYEKLWAEDESVSPTTHPKIMRLRHEPIDPDWLESRLVELEQLAEAGDTLEVVARLAATVREPKRAVAASEGAESVRAEA
ncbi:MAG TPA: nucleoside-diphosphate sugar epimerase/dehydratase [Gaiellaceae bacterium]|nr:nucleoside-diphosphate sugar epimerase/dehydratase [Gaiellaceae bacterium]